MSQNYIVVRVFISSHFCRNCVDRFLDTNIMVTKQLESKASQMLKNHDSLGEGL